MTDFDESKLTPEQIKALWRFERRFCPMCAKAFTPRVVKHVYCSNTCRRKANYHKNKQREHQYYNEHKEYYQKYYHERYLNEKRDIFGE